MDQSITIILFFAAILIFAGILFAVIALTKRGPRQLNVDWYRSEWMKIEGQLQQSDEHMLQMAVLNADKLLDKALQERAIGGENMGARMKQMQGKWTDANAVWSAHKLRNRIAHESNVKVDRSSARRALAGFKRGLKDMGAI